MTDESAASRVEDWLRVMAGNAGFRTTRELKSYQNAEKQILDIVRDQDKPLLEVKSLIGKLEVMGGAKCRICGSEMEGMASGPEGLKKSCKTALEGWGADSHSVSSKWWNHLNDSTGWFRQGDEKFLMVAKWLKDIVRDLEARAKQK